MPQPLPLVHSPLDTGHDDDGVAFCIQMTQLTDIKIDLHSLTHLLVLDILLPWRIEILGP